MENLNKKELRELNVQEARGWVIDRFYQIELRINKIIVEYFKPEKNKEFEVIVLHSSIIDIGSKLRILSNIPGIDNKIIDKIRKISSIRNGFAHAPISETIYIKCKENEKEDILVSGQKETFIEVMNSQGKLLSKPAFEYLAEFAILNNEIRQIM